MFVVNQLLFILTFLFVRVGRIVQYSEDSEAGEGQRKRFRVSREEEEMDSVNGDVKMKKKKKKNWTEQEPSSSHTLEVSHSDVYVCVFLKKALMLSRHVN